MLLLLFARVGGVIPPTPTPVDTGGTGGSDPGETRKPLAESTQGLQIRRAPRAKPAAQAETEIPVSEVSEIQTLPPKSDTTPVELDRLQLLELDLRQLALDGQRQALALAAQQRAAEEERQAGLLLAAQVARQRWQREQDDIALVLLMAD